ncbi:MAG: putative Mg2+ transporter-C (MgtC) family protein [Chloroflexota bacterium]|jgi:putative Mg2+ transporter-C (MgtC) family protein|nr:putative Mg2+ transporter-C (MgtC) family protein [Chloroflexota bacterium]
MPPEISTQLDLALRLLVALLLGMAVGTEREFSRHPAGLRTLALVSMGSCLFSSIALLAVPGSQDPTRIAAQVVTGIGFLGAGAILRQGERVKGLTTAASIWVVAAIGMTCGFGYYLLALLATVMTLVALLVVRRWEDRVLHKGDRPTTVLPHDPHDPHDHE